MFLSHFYVHNIPRVYNLRDKRHNFVLIEKNSLGGTTGSASDQRSEGCGFEAY